MRGALRASIFVAIAAKIILSISSISSSGKFVWFGAVLAVVGIAFFLGFMPRLNTGTGNDRPVRTAGSQEISMDLLRPVFTHLARLFAISVLTNVVMGLFSKNAIYVAKYAFHDPAFVGTALIALMMGKLVSVPLLTALERPLGVGPLLWGLFGAQTLASAMFYFAPLSYTTFAASLFIFGLILGGTNLLTWAMLPNLTRKLSDTGIGRAEACCFGWFTSFGKIASGASGMLLGLILSTADLNSGYRAEGNLAESLCQYMGVTAFVCSLLSVACLVGYRQATVATKQVW